MLYIMPCCPELQHYEVAVMAGKLYVFLNTVQNTYLHVLKILR